MDGIDRIYPKGVNSGMTDGVKQPLFWFGLVVLLAGVVWFVLTRPQPAAAAQYSDVSVQELHAAVERGALVIDVREPHEFAEGRVPGSVLVPLASVAARSGEFGEADTVYVICRSGNRSAVAAETLVGAGFEDVRNVEGGMLAWEAAGLPIEP